MQTGGIPRYRTRTPLGQLAAFHRDRIELMDEIHASCGDLAEFGLGLGWTRVFLVSSRELAAAVLIDQAADFKKSRGLSVFARPLLGNGLLTSEGRQHRRQRSLMAPAFHHRRIAEYARVFAEAAEETVARWADGAVVDVADEMMRLTLGIVCRTLFSADVSTDATEIGEALTIANRSISRQIGTLLPPSWPTPNNFRLRRAIDRLDAVVYRLIRERRTEGGDRGDVLSMLLAARDGDDGMSDLEIRDEVMTMMLAGHETTANALAWSFHLLSESPEVAGRLVEEARGALGGRTPGLEDVPRLPYASAVVHEAMRLYPPVYIVGRQPLWNVRLGGHHVPEGSTIFIGIRRIHRRPDYWPDAESFVPERWLGGLERTLPPGTYLPFGGGPRSCIGSQFAWLEAQLLLATIAQRVRLEGASSGPVVPEPLITLRPRGGLPMRVQIVEDRNRRPCRASVPPP